MEFVKQTKIDLYDKGFKLQEEIAETLKDQGETI